jgi:hypothetical protein
LTSTRKLRPYYFSISKEVIKQIAGKANSHENKEKASKECFTLKLTRCICHIACWVWVCMLTHTCMYAHTYVEATQQ